MVDGPTTMNGPLHDRDASPETRKIVAYFANAAAAGATRDALLAEGIDGRHIAVQPAAAEAANLSPADDTLVGRVREAILPDDGQVATRKAVQADETMLTVESFETDASRIIDLIQAGRPSRFDAELERWRNTAPTT